MINTAGLLLFRELNRWTALSGHMPYRVTAFVLRQITKRVFEKIAVYADSQEKPTHAARQLSSGHWTSKLGGMEDIEHYTLEGLNGAEYGVVALVMKRQKNTDT